MKVNKKKKAFTLTELLVVVIIIGVLSAVVLPKFNKIIETRKTTEAEELMAAVRTEQEKRCALDRDYLADISSMLPSTTTKNFIFSNEGGTGISATSKGKYEYKLIMPSYEDGRICCDDSTAALKAECLKLNKDYIPCTELIAKADYQDGTACLPSSSVGGGESCTKKSYEESCPEGQAGKIVYTVNDQCEYEVTNTCVPASSSCTAGEWITDSAPVQSFNTLLSSDCTNTLGLGGNARTAVDVNTVTASCTDYSAITIDTNKIAVSSGADTCNASMDPYTCSSNSKDECIDIQFQSGKSEFATVSAGIECRCSRSGVYSPTPSGGSSSSSSGSGSGGGSTSSMGPDDFPCNPYPSGIIDDVNGVRTSNLKTCTNITSDPAYSCVLLFGRESGTTFEEGYKCVDSWGTPDCMAKGRERLIALWNSSGTGYINATVTEPGSAPDAQALKCSSANRYKISCVQQYQYRQITCK